MNNRVKLAEQAVASLEAKRATTANRDQLERQITAAKARLREERIKAHEETSTAPLPLLDALMTDTFS